MLTCYDDATVCQQFKDTFETEVNTNENISDVETFTYLRSYLGGEAEKCIDGLSLSSENYKHALNLLSERDGNAQLIISWNMDKLLKLEKIHVTTFNMKELRALHDRIVSNLCSLLSCGIHSEHYGPMPIPSNIKLEINRKLGKNQWKTDEVMHILKVEIEARGNCHFHKSESRNREGGDDRRGMKIGSFTTESLITSNRVIKCAFCKQTHYSDR